MTNKYLKNIEYALALFSIIYGIGGVIPLVIYSKYISSNNIFISIASLIWIFSAMGFIYFLIKYGMCEDV